MSKLKSIAPLLILGVFAVGAAAIWIPRSESSAHATGTPTLNELDARLSSGSKRLSDLIEITNARPVFHASRRPVSAPVAPKAPEPVLSLLGVIADDDGETLAFVKLSSNGALYRIGEGETVGRWRVVEIGIEEISVSKDGDSPYTLRIGD